MSLREEIFRSFPALNRLVAAGPHDRAWIVGGAVRDLLRGGHPADVDVASPDPMACAQLVGGKVIRLGRDHLSAWRVVTDGHLYDFAELLDGDIGTDLGRRDFTVNAMAVGMRSGELLDPFGGQADLNARIVRMVAARNFDDDPLRMLKAVRMAVVLGFEIEPSTLDAIRPRAESIVSIAPERVTYELSLIAGGGALRKAVKLLADTGLGGALGLRMPSLEFDDVPLAAALALLVADPTRFGERWRWSTSLVSDVSALQRLERRHDLVELFQAGERAAHQLPPMLRALGRPSEVSMPDFSMVSLLNGNAIVEATGAAGAAIGRLKRCLVEAQLRGEVVTAEDALAFVRERAAAIRSE